MGRHASPDPQRSTGAGRELLLWGLFSVPVTVVLLGVLGSGWTLALLVGGLELVVFAVVWLAVVTSRGSRGDDGHPLD